MNAFYTVRETVETTYKTSDYDGKRYPSDYSIFHVMNGAATVESFSALDYGLDDAEYMALALRDKLNRALPKATVPKVESPMPDSIDNLHNENVKLKADLAAAQNIIVQAGKDFEALKADNARMKEAIEVATEAMQQSIQDKDLVRSWQLQSWVSPLLKAVKPKAVQAPKSAIPASVSVNWTGRGLSTGKYPVLGHSQAGKYYVLDISTDPNTPMPKRVSFADCGV